MFDIIIVGGGISGLYTYYNLISSNQKICLLEKNSYYGGRIYQQQETYLSKQYSFPAGAARFNENHTNVIKLLKHFKLLDFRKDKKLSASMKFIDSKNKFSEYKHDNGFYYVDKVLKAAKNYSKTELQSLTFKELSKQILTKKELNYMLVSSGNSGQLKNMNAYNAVYLFNDGIRPDLNYWLGKFNLIINKLVTFLNKNNGNIKLNSQVKSVCLNNTKDCYEVTVNNRILYTKKIIFCLPKPALLKMNILKPIHCILDRSVTCKSLCRTYAIFKDCDFIKNLKKKIVTNNHLRYIIPIDPANGLIMISYTDEIYTKYWNSIKNNQEKLKEKIVALIKETFNVKIEKPVKVFVCNWDCGVAYWNKNIKSEEVADFILNPIENIYICGENYSLNQSWVEGSLETANSVIKLLEC